MIFKKSCFQRVGLSVWFLLLSNLIIAQKQFKALLITETAGWYHESIEAGVVAINELAETHNFEVERQQIAQKITEDKLNKFDVIIFLSTTGDIFDENEKLAIQKFIQSGKGYVGIHAASDTEFGWEWYNKLVGRMFYVHPKQQTAKLRILNHDFPGLESFPNSLLWTDEWYEFGPEKVSGLKYLITVDEKTYKPETTWKGKDKDAAGNLVDRSTKGMGNFHPISWYHEFDGGRSFYTALGHINNVYKNHWFLEHLYGGIYYAATGVCK